MRQDTKYKIQTIRYSIHDTIDKTHYVKYKIKDIRYKIRYKNEIQVNSQDTKYKIQDTKYKMKKTRQDTVDK